MKRTVLGVVLFVLGEIVFGAQTPAAQSGPAGLQEIQLKGLQVRLGRPVEVTAQTGWHMNGLNFDGWSFIHLTPMLAKFPKGELIVTYTLDPDAQHDPVFLSGFQTSSDGGTTWGTRYGVLMQHIPMIFIPGKNDSLIAAPSEFLADKTENGKETLRGPLLRFEQGGRTMVMEQDGAHVLDWPWPLQLDANPQPKSNWHSSLYLTGDAIRAKGQLLATAYWKRKNETKYANGLLSSSDGGHTWRYYSTIAAAEDVLPRENWKQKGFEGPDETSMIRLANGELMAVFRVGGSLDWKLRRSYSNDDGRTWSKPDILTAWSVEPKLVRVANGTIALASGRPGLGLWLSTDARAQSWQQIDIAVVHNSFSSDPFYRISPLDASHPEKMWQTSSYTGLVEMEKNHLLLAYDRSSEGAPKSPEDLSRVFVMPIEIDRK